MAWSKRVQAITRFVCKCVGVYMRWCVHALVCICVGVYLRWCVFALVCICVTQQSPMSRPLAAYPRAAPPHIACYAVKVAVRAVLCFCGQEPCFAHCAECGMSSDERWAGDGITAQTARGSRALEQLPKATALRLLCGGWAAVARPRQLRRPYQAFAHLPKCRHVPVLGCLRLEPALPCGAAGAQ